MMKSQKIKLTQSIFFKSLVLLIFSMTLVVSMGTYLITNRQTESTVDFTFNIDQKQLNQLTLSVNNEIEQFGNQLALIAKSSEVRSMDTVVASGYLKGYSTASLFISGENVSLYNRATEFICDNSMLGSGKKIYPIDFSAISPHRPYVSAWYRDGDEAPKKAFGVVVEDRAVGNGYLVANFSLRRLWWKHFAEYKAGKQGLLIAVNAAGEILYHPDLKRWLNGVHKFTELGLEEFDPKNYEVKEPTFVKLNDGGEYLLNYMYSNSYDLGLISLHSKNELDSVIKHIQVISLFVLVASLMAILFVAFWQSRIISRPLNQIISHIWQITDGDMDVEEIPENDREDEIGRLSKSFNLMHRTIRKQIKELNAHRNLLEQEVKERTLELETVNRKLDMISRTDELTQLPNRRDMNETIENEIGRSSRTHSPFCFIFIDIDHFKQVNDTYGHAVGDAVLKFVSKTIRGLLRKYDVLSRYGGEEFLALLPETDLDGAKVVAERFRQKIEEASVTVGEQTIKVTISLGVARFDARLGADRSIQLADKALYEAKETGRNKVIIWDPEQVSEQDYVQAALEMAQKKNKV